jgi:hypothetical protein
MTTKNGEVQAPQPRPDDIVVETAEVAPIIFVLNSCTFNVNRRPDGLRELSFVHKSGAFAALAMLTDENVADLIRQLTGGIDVARSIPVLR